jgi:AcrR family transcriptional regulator
VGAGGTGRRAQLLAAATEYVLDHGVTTLSLRPLAAAIGTSDRMLLYYFTTREALLAAVLTEIAGRLRQVLLQVLPDEPAPPAAVLAASLRAAADPAAQRPLRVWVEVVGLSAAGDPTCAATATAISRAWVDWLSDRIDAPEAERGAAAAAVLAVIDGLVLEAQAGLTQEAGAAAAWLVRALS